MFVSLNVIIFKKTFWPSSYITIYERVQKTKRNKTKQKFSVIFCFLPTFEKPEKMELTSINSNFVRCLCVCGRVFPFLLPFGI